MQDVTDLGFPPGAFERGDEDDECPHYAAGWSSFARQGNPGSYRFMYDPDSGTCHSMPVPTPTAFRESIVSLEGQP